MFRINDSKLSRYGIGGLSISLPAFFHQPIGAKPKDTLPTYITKVNGVKCLVIASEKLPELSDNNISGNESKMLGNSND